VFSFMPETMAVVSLPNGFIEYDMTAGLKGQRNGGAEVDPNKTVVEGNSILGQTDRSVGGWALFLPRSPQLSNPAFTRDGIEYLRFGKLDQAVFLWRNASSERQVQTQIGRAWAGGDSVVVQSAISGASNASMTCGIARGWHGASAGIFGRWRGRRRLNHLCKGS
jgi:hypothetical protein